jgi:hypothetical protein
MGVVPFLLLGPLLATEAHAESTPPEPGGAWEIVVGSPIRVIRNGTEETTDGGATWRTVGGSGAARPSKRSGPTRLVVRTFLSRYVGVEVFVDGRRVGDLVSSKPVRFEVAPGHHELRFYKKGSKFVGYDFSCAVDVPEGGLKLSLTKDACP